METKPSFATQLEEKLFFEGQYERCLDLIRNNILKLSDYDDRKQNLAILGSQCLFEMGQGSQIQSFCESSYQKPLMMLPPTVFFVYINYLFHSNQYKIAIKSLKQFHEKGKPMNNNEYTQWVQLIVCDGYINHRKYHKAAKFLRREYRMDREIRNNLMDQVELKQKHDTLLQVTSSEFSSDSDSESIQFDDRKHDDPQINDHKEDDNDKTVQTRWDYIKQNIFHIINALKTKFNKRTIIRIICFFVLLWILLKISKRYKKTIKTFMSDFRKLFIMSIASFFLLSTMAFSLISYLDGADDCSSQSHLGFWGLILWTLIIIYLFTGLYVLCEVYFVPILISISNRLNMSEDVAGATLMAAGSSAPELFTALIGVCFYANENPGPSTNCASAAFNMCVIIGCSIFFCGYQGLAIRAYPFIRDCSFYALAVIELYLFWEVISPGKIEWSESLSLIISWMAYIVVLIYNNKVIKICVNIMEWMGLSNAEEMLYEQLKCRKRHSTSSLLNSSDYSDDCDCDDSPIEYQKIVKQAPPSREPVDLMEETESGYHGSRHFIPMEMEEVDTETLTQEMQQNKNSLRILKQAPNIMRKETAAGDTTASGSDTNQTHHHHQITTHKHHEEIEAPRLLNKCQVYFENALLPFHILFKYTIPRTNFESTTPVLSAAFILVLVWLAILTFICVDAAEKMGNCLAISEDVMGLTLLAIGSSLPDCFSSILAAKQNKGEMAVSNALGSNVFDINICIGVSFFLKSILSGFKPVIVERDEGFELFIAALFVLLAIFMVAMFCYGLVLNKTIGAGLFAAYAVFLGAFCYLLQFD